MPGHPLEERTKGKSNQAAEMIQFQQWVSSEHFCSDRWGWFDKFHLGLISRFHKDRKTQKGQTSLTKGENGRNNYFSDATVWGRLSTVIILAMLPWRIHCDLSVQRKNQCKPTNTFSLNYLCCCLLCHLWFSCFDCVTFQFPVKQSDKQIFSHWYL